MRILVVKLTSMGDVLHLMPALTDLCKTQSNVIIDWMVEDSFADIPSWHPNVERVVAVSTRRWRRFGWASISEFFKFVTKLRSVRYDAVVDAQGLMKSAVFSRLAKRNKGGYCAGFSGDSIKESPAAWLYNKKIPVARDQHAIKRLRQLLAVCFNYSYNDESLDYGFDVKKSAQPSKPSIMLLHGTTWSSKHLPDALWRKLADVITDDGYKVKLCWGNERERQRAEWIAEERPSVTVLDNSTLDTLAKELARTSGAIAVDTGLGHMAAALAVPCVSVYGSTNAALTGTMGENQSHMQSGYPCSPCLLKKCDKLTAQVTLPPCYQQFDAATIWQTLHTQIV